ncbi:MAG: hypothetical protein JWO19_1859, partial [Bryobacterales bacterium]|nr:hypothetical protein [Bryobacterales bacterium]
MERPYTENMRALQYILGIVLVGGLLATIWIMITAPTGEVAAPKAAPVEPYQAGPAFNVPAPDTIVFDNKYGKATFTHKLHYERVKDDCATCHPRIFPQS